MDRCYSGKALTLILLTWGIGWALNNVSRLQMGFNLAFKGLSISYSMCAFVGLGTQREMRLRRIVVCGLSVSTMSIHIIS